MGRGTVFEAALMSGLHPLEILAIHDQIRRTPVPDKPICPRAIEDGREPFVYLNRPEEPTCDYCGSLLGDLFMERLEAGDVLLGATDKAYKVYVINAGGPEFVQHYRVDEDRSGDQQNWRWARREVDHAKFYFQHLTVEQQQRFVELLNAGRLRMQGGYQFYVLPYFIKRD